MINQAALAQGAGGPERRNTMRKRIAVMKGDGIGPEIVNEALKRAGDRSFKITGTPFRLYILLISAACAIDNHGHAPAPGEPSTPALRRTACCWARWAAPSGTGVARGISGRKRRLLGIRKRHGPVSPICGPAKLFPAVGRRERLCAVRTSWPKGIDFMVARELIGGVYFGEHRTVDAINGERVAHMT